MKGKVIRYSFILFSLLISFSSLSQKVYLSGSIKNYYNELEVEDISELQPFNLPEEGIFFLPDSSGKFEITFQLHKSNYFRIGRNILYLTPGDSLYMEIDCNRPEKALFKGLNAEANLFLATTPFPKAGSFLASGDNIKESIEKTVDTILKISKRRENLLNSLKTISEEFRKLENARIKADFLNSISLLYTYYVYEHNIKKDSLSFYAKKCNAIKEVFYKENSNNFLSPRFLKLFVYRKIVRDLIYYTYRKEKTPFILKEYIELETLSEKVNTTNAKDSLENLKKKVLKRTNSSCKRLLLNKINKLLLFSNGSMAKPFEALDSNGKSVNLSNFKNKVIYIDIWATWCEPCLKQMPSFELLREKYSKNTDVVFISLSIDDNFDVWKNNIAKRKATGEQWLINRYKMKDYNIFFIPRAILINKNFKVAEMKAELPGSKNVETQINSLL